MEIRPAAQQQQEQHDDEEAEAAPLLQTLRRPPTSSASSSSVLSAQPQQPQQQAGQPRMPASASGSSSSLSRHASGSSVAGQAAQPAAELGTCRICFESEPLHGPPAEPNNPLISPCHCAGSSRFVHRQCLATWRATDHRRDAAFACEVCKFRYQYRRLWWAGLLGAPATVLTLYLLVMACLIAALGFVPITQWLTTPSAASGGGGGAPPASPAPAPPSPGGGAAPPWWALLPSHVLNGLIALGVLGLVLSTVLLGVRGCCVQHAGALRWLPDPGTGCLLCCCDMSGGGPGLGWSLLECASVGAECGLVVVAVAVVLMLVTGIAASMRLLYAAVWTAVAAGLDYASQMVENVQPPVHGGAGGGGGTGGGKAAAAAVTAAAGS